MKYVRTKDKILPYYNESTTGKLTVVLKDIGIVAKNKVDETFDKIVIKQSYSVGKLCDYFICNELFVGEEDETEFLASVGETVYGAIWTEWGLKYVAKMSEEGVWELL